MKLIAITFIFLSSSAAWAQQELRSINNTVLEISDDLHATAYIASRCAGIFDGVVAYGGQNMPEALVEGYYKASADLTMGTTLIRVLQAQNRGLPPKSLDTEMENSIAEMTQFSNMYKERFVNNYQISGTMLEQDPIASDDLDFCGEALPRIRSIVARILGETDN